MEISGPLKTDGCSMRDITITDIYRITVPHLIHIIPSEEIQCRTLFGNMVQLVTRKSAGQEPVHIIRAAYMENNILQWAIISQYIFALV